MLDFIFQLPDYQIFILLSVSTTLLSLIAVYVVRRVLPLKLRRQDNAVIGNIGGIVGMIYGVLVGLTALYLFNNNNYTSDAVQHEANSVANIYRDSKWLKDPTRTAIQNDVKRYINAVVGTEWPLMESGKDIPDDGDNIIESIDKELRNYPFNNVTNVQIVHDAEDIKLLYDARQTRIGMSNTQLSPEIWLVVMIGTILTIGINFLYRSNFSLHIIAITAAGLMASSMLFLLVTLDRPFQGEFIIEPDALKSVSAFIEKNP